MPSSELSSFYGSDVSFMNYMSDVDLEKDANLLLSEWIFGNTVQEKKEKIASLHFQLLYGSLSGDEFYCTQIQSGCNVCTGHMHYQSGASAHGAKYRERWA